jgi:hypothetical protein
MSTLMSKNIFITAVFVFSILLSSILTSTTKRVAIVSAFTTPPTILSLSTSTRTNKNKNNDNIFACRRRRRLYANNNDPNDKNNNNDNGLSASNRERREEDKRRNARKEDVIIGKTSAKRGEKDYVIDPKATEIEYLRSVSRTEQLIYQYTQDGMDEMNSLKLDDANKSFDKVFELKPEAYLWQAGIVKFYLKDYLGAADIFARNAIYYETKFSRPMGIDPASEERIWRNASELKYMNGLKRSERKQYLIEKEEMILKQKSTTMTMIPQIQEKEQQEEDDEEDVMVETRKVLKLTNELFVATVEQKIDVEVVARAQLLSIVAGDEKSSSQPNAQRLVLDRKKRKLNAWYYLGLHHDVTGNKEESKRCIKMAFKLAGLNAGKSSDIMATLPLLHMTARDWFDDEPYCDDDENDGFDDNFDDNFDPTGTTTTTTDSVIEKESDDSQDHLSDAYSDPVVEKSIMSSVEKMKFPQIKDALLIRGLSVTGSKQLLKERLFISLMDDAGFQSGFAP